MPAHPTRSAIITTKALELLKENPQGIRYSQLVRLLHDFFPDFPVNTIHGTIWNLDDRKSQEIYKPERGLFRHIKFRETKVIKETPEEVKEGQLKETEFYKPFAEYLTNDLQECTKAISLGGNLFRDKWGTPDVIGKREPNRSDIVKFDTEIVSAEIKIDSFGLITAFGQACAYKIFSHRVYLVIPNDSSEEDKSRIESLSLSFGIGLILFNRRDAVNPGFEIRVRPTRHNPDMFYVNKYMKLVERDLFR